jgi:hypothetical protein
MPNHNVRLHCDPLPRAESRLLPSESEGDRHRQRHVIHRPKNEEGR